MSAASETRAWDADAAAGGWLANHHGRIDVTWFGAKGDGKEASAAENVRAINAALKAATRAATTHTPGTVYFPFGEYCIDSPIVYVGHGEALNLLGESGGILAGSGSRLKWVGDNDETMMSLSGLWRGVIERLDWFAEGVAAGCLHAHSDQSALVGIGAGWASFVIRHCGFYNVRAAASDPMLVRLGIDTGGSTHQVDLTTFEHCYFIGNLTEPEAVTLVKMMQGGNTKDFAFQKCHLLYGRYGIDSLAGSGTLSIDRCFFGGITDGDDGDEAACIRASGAVRVAVRSCAVENGSDGVGALHERARFIVGNPMGSSPDNGLLVESCNVMLDLPDDGVVIDYPAKQVLLNNRFGGAVEDVADYRMKIKCSPLKPGTEPAGALPAGAIISMGNDYGHANLGDYAPFYEGSNPLCGPAASSFAGPRRVHVYSLGDTASDGDDGVGNIPLEPWFGTMPNHGAQATTTWNPPSMAAGTGTSTTMNWPVSGVLTAGDHITVTFSEPLPAGVMLTAAISAADQVQATLFNTTGSPVDLASGTLTFTASRRT